MKILLTNDDGIEANGLAALHSAVERIDGAEIVIVAPMDAQSGVSHRVTTDAPLRVETRSANSFAVDGTPCDCVRLALTKLAPGIDWIFSGINDGGNLGVDIHMSGTVAACREGALMGVPGVAFSQYVRRPEETDWEAAAEMVLATWQRLQRHGLPRGGFWNVNFPHRPALKRLPNPVLCPPESQPLTVDYASSGDNGFQYLGNYAGRPQTPGRDVEVCFKGGIAITKLSAGWD